MIGDYISQPSLVPLNHRVYLSTLARSQALTRRMPPCVGLAPYRRLLAAWAENNYF